MTSAEQYTPRNYSELDYVAAAKRTADAILRSNPLTNAVVSRGLMRWIGNHVDANGNKVNFLWIGDFVPADTTMGGISQRGVAMWRDDSTSVEVNQGRLAFALYDHAPGDGGLGLRQTIHVRSLDGKDLLNEARNGGQSFPRMPIPMGATGLPANWITTQNAAFHTLSEGQCSVVGKHVMARYWTGCTADATGEFQVVVEWAGGGTASGPVHAVAASTTPVFEDYIDVSAARGQTITVKIQGHRTSGAGTCYTAPIAFANFTNAP